MSLMWLLFICHFFNLYFFVSFQHKTCLKRSRSEKSLSVRLAVLDFHTSACFLFYFLLFGSLTFWVKKTTLLCRYGRRVIFYPCACEGLRVHKMYTQHSYTTHCVIVCENLCLCVCVCPCPCVCVCVCVCVWCVSDRCGHHAKSSLLILLVHHRMSSISPTLWPPGTGSPEGRV